MKLISILFIAAESWLVCSLKVQINQPWAESSWVGGQDATVVFEAIPGGNEVFNTVNIDLMAGNPLDGLLVTNIATDIPISRNSLVWKVPDYPSNSDYFVRIGNSDNFVFSHTFTIKGQGKTALPVRQIIEPIVDLPEVINSPQQTTSKSNDFNDQKPAYSEHNDNDDSSRYEKYTPHKAKVESNNSTKSSDARPFASSSYFMLASFLSVLLLSIN